RLVFTWSWKDDGEPDADVEDTVVVTFERAEAGTLVTVEHTSVAHEPEGGAVLGWNDVMDRLVGLYDESQSTSSRS
ncbi:MAG TPA: SRPBCC domain-containing protein, partial [Nocardioides sp.]|nr:SRPBCC domain-containing protein [Nocardioides sp.]